jgi:hypothetical protein
MKYAYEDFHFAQFELLVILICQKLLGISVQGFAQGPDGGRDAKFHGTAELYPSRREPWQGITIVQAKHTTGFNKSFSDLDFYSTKSSSTLIGMEIPRIKKLYDNDQLNHYMLFSNRRLPARKESEIRKFISNECGIPEQSLSLCGIEQIEIYLKTFPDIPQKANFDPIDTPLIITPDELAEIVEALLSKKDDISLIIEKEIHEIERISYEQKNITNNMSEDYAKILLNKYLKHTKQIQNFLSDPENIDIVEKYQNSVEEMNLKIIANRKDHQLFDHVMNYLFDLLFSRDQTLSRNKQLTKSLLFYMYWNCDIGINK